MSLPTTAVAATAPSDLFPGESGETTELCLIVAGMHCAGCMRKIENGLAGKSVV